MSETNGSTPVSDETATAGQPHQPHIKILRGNPTDEEVVALMTVLGSVGGTPAQPPTESTRWGLPVDRLRYAISNYQRITLQERVHMRR
ncbi:acyl-CoA carboxylase subunit epsilon [Mycobacterium tilburgii]|uniref:acyl-CoA carboxylase subunit epsilon n=1 Tax=Mycobacterium tilburgii TaxID=44467 RepID=UPI001182403A|nr:acyl-CoA carboxylase subunit epsilon [Mycobacterium tilburgii]